MFLSCMYAFDPLSYLYYYKLYLDLLTFNDKRQYTDWHPTNIRILQFPARFQAELPFSIYAPIFYYYYKSLSTLNHSIFLSIPFLSSYMSANQIQTAAQPSLIKSTSINGVNLAAFLSVNDIADFPSDRQQTCRRGESGKGLFQSQRQQIDQVNQVLVR